MPVTADGGKQVPDRTRIDSPVSSTSIAKGLLMSCSSSFTPPMDSSIWLPYKKKGAFAYFT